MQSENSEFWENRVSVERDKRVISENVTDIRIKTHGNNSISVFLNHSMPTLGPSAVKGLVLAIIRFFANKDIPILFQHRTNISDCGQRELVFQVDPTLAPTLHFLEVEQASTQLQKWASHRDESISY